MNKAQVHHLVGFIKDEDFNVLQRYRPLLNQVDQAARRRDKNIDTAGKTLFLAENRHAAEHAIDLQAQKFAISAEAVGDLRGKFACRRQDKHPAAILLTRLWLGGEMMQGRQRKCSSLARSGLRNTAKIAAFKQGWNGLLLNGGRRIIASRLKRLQDRLGKAQVLEKRHIYTFKIIVAAHEACPFIRTAQAQQQVFGSSLC